MEFPDDVHYTAEHEWLRLEDDGLVVVGITDYAQDQLGDIVFVQLPDVSDTVLSKDEKLAEIESVKTVSEVYAPISGKVVKVNKDLVDGPEVINEDPYGYGWLVHMEPSDDDPSAGLMSADEYRDLVSEGD